MLALLSIAFSLPGALLARAHSRSRLYEHALHFVTRSRSDISMASHARGCRVAGYLSGPVRGRHPPLGGPAGWPAERATGVINHRPLCSSARISCQLARHHVEDTLLSLSLSLSFPRLTLSPSRFGSPFSFLFRAAFLAINPLPERVRYSAEWRLSRGARAKRAEGKRQEGEREDSSISGVRRRAASDEIQNPAILSRGRGEGRRGAAPGKSNNRMS